jgi:hypothetical protein
MYNYTWRIPLSFISPCRFPFIFPFDPFLLTWNPPSCDRIRPPRSQVACKLTSSVPTLYPNPPPSKFPNPNCPAPYYDDLRNNRASSVWNSSELFTITRTEIQKQFPAIFLNKCNNNLILFGFQPFIFFAFLHFSCFVYIFFVYVSHLCFLYSMG